MEKLNIKPQEEVAITVLEGAKAPSYATLCSAGADLYAHSIKAVYKGGIPVPEDTLYNIQKSFNERGYIKLRGFERILFGTGIKLDHLDNKYKLNILPKSGLSLKKGLTVLNSPGLIDSDYRDEIGVILLNTSPFLVSVEKMSKIAQIEIGFNLKTKAFSQEEKERSGGFGSTGLK